MPETVPEILNLADEVRDRQARRRRVFRTPLSVRQMTGTAAASGRREFHGAMRDHVGHRRVIAGKPVDDVLTIPDVYQRVRGGTPVDLPRLRLFDRILIRTQVPRRRRLRLRFVARFGWRVEPVRREARVQS